MKPRIRLVATLAVSSLLFSGCAVVGDQYASADTPRRSLSTVAGDVHVDDGAHIADASTVAGDIRIDNNSTTGDLKTTAGDVEIGQNVTVNGSIRSTAGDVNMGSGGIVRGGITNLAGSIELDHCHVEGRIESAHGDINVSGSRIDGGILIKHSRHNRDWINITIGPGSTVPSIDVRQPEKVSLRISRDANVGEVIGVEPEYF